MSIPFCGKRINQDSTKLKNIQGRERRLNKIGLSLHAFVQKQNWLYYFTGRNYNRLPVINTQETQTEQTNN